MCLRYGNCVCFTHSAHPVICLNNAVSFQRACIAPFLMNCCDVPGPPPSQARSSSGQRRRSSVARVPLETAAAAPPGPSSGPCPAPVQRESYGKEVARKWGWEARDNMCVAGKLCHLCDTTIRCQFLKHAPCSCACLAYTAFILRRSRPLPRY